MTASQLSLRNKKSQPLLRNKKSIRNLGAAVTVALLLATSASDAAPIAHRHGRRDLAGESQMSNVDFSIGDAAWTAADPQVDLFANQPPQTSTWSAPAEATPLILIPGSALRRQVVGSNHQHVLHARDTTDDAFPTAAAASGDMGQTTATISSPTAISSVTSSSVKPTTTMHTTSTSSSAAAKQTHAGTGLDDLIYQNDDGFTPVTIMVPDELVSKVQHDLAYNGVPSVQGKAATGANVDDGNKNSTSSTRLLSGSHHGATSSHNATAHGQHHNGTKHAVPLSHHNGTSHELPQPHHNVTMHGNKQNATQHHHKAAQEHHGGGNTHHQTKTPQQHHNTTAHHNATAHVNVTTHNHEKTSEKASAEEITNSKTFWQWLSQKMNLSKRELQGTYNLQDLQLLYEREAW